MKLSIVAGATSQSVNVFVRDSTSTTGGGLAGVAPAGGALLTGTKLYYSFTGANAASVSVALSVLATVGAGWSSAGIVTIDGTNMIGWVRIDLPNAALVSGKGRVVSFLLFGGTNMAPTPFEIELTGWDNQDAVHGGMSALPNTACTTNASLLTSGTGTDQLSVTSGRVDIGKALGTAVTLDSNNVLNVSAKYLAGTALTGRDIGASVLLSAGTGTGQLDFTSGVAKANTVQILGGACPAVNVTGVPKVDVADWLGSAPNALVSGRVDASIGANNAGNLTADVQTIKTQTVTCAAGVTVGAFVGNATAAVAVDASGGVTVGAFEAALGWQPLRTGTAQAGANNTITLDTGASATDNIYSTCLVRITGGTGAGQVRVISQYIGSTKVATTDQPWQVNPDNTTTFAILPIRVTVLNASGKANVGTVDTIGNGAIVAASFAVGAAAPIATAVWQDLTAGGDFGTAGSIGKLIVTTGLTVASVTGNVTVGAYASGQDPYTLVMKTVMTEGYAANGSAPTMEQATFRLMQNLCEFSIASTTITVKKLDRSTAAETYTLDSASAPTQRTRAT